MPLRDEVRAQARAGREDARGVDDGAQARLQNEEGLDPLRQATVR